MSPPKKKIDPESFFLCRIIGNDLVPRHTLGQSRQNVRFILDNEPAFERCRKFWIVNRIVDDGEREAIVQLLDERRQDYSVIPFDLSEYAKAKLDISRAPAGATTPTALLSMETRKRLALLAALRTSKTIAAIGINTARNAALALGREKANWVLPWDGNCFVTASAWAQIRDTVLRRHRLPYFVVPMARILDNNSLLNPDFLPDAQEEPQIVFRRDAQERFDERYAYGHLNKVELLQRLGVPGRWQNWSRSPWDLPPSKPSPDAGKFATAGWVARLWSGQDIQEAGEGSSTRRASARTEAILDFLDRLDAMARSHSAEDANTERA